jgi:hypothetical protein
MVGKASNIRLSRGRLRHLGVGLLIVWVMISLATAWSADENGRVSREVSIEWSAGQPTGQILVSGGVLAGLKVSRGKGAIQAPDRFTSSESGGLRLDLSVVGNDIRYGKGGTIVTLATREHPFSFFLRDVTRDQPIFIPAYWIIVATGGDQRSYRDIETEIRARGMQTKLQQIESEAEETFEDAAQNTRELKCPTWLGLSRDVRIFEVDVRLESITPRFHGTDVTLPESQGKPIQYQFLMGRGWSVADSITRRLDDGIFPILHGTVVDDDISYELTAFAALEASPLTAGNVRGTHFLVADGYGLGHMFTQEQQAQRDALLPAEMNREEETVLCLRVVAVNTKPVPRYAFFRNVAPNLGRASSGGKAPWTLDGRRGFSVFESGRVFAVSKLDGKPLAAEELAILLEPGEASTLTVYLPHRPISVERAARLANRNFEEALESSRQYWREKLAAATQIELPERRITEMIRAGLLHLDLVSYGLEPDGTLVPTIGRYTAIGTESSPIMQFMDTMGWHDVARRAATFFLDKQHEDGFIQNFGDYMVETGAALWSMGEHYRLTRNEQWAKQIQPQVIKACEYMLQWRQRNMREDLRGRGYGLLDGKTADPEDPFHSFMLSGYAYLGMSRVAEMLKDVDAAAARKWSGEAQAFKADIRRAFAEAMAKSPVIPLADGSWCPTVPPWVEYRGPLALFADGGNWFTHGAVVGRDSLLGPLYLVFTEVIGPDELEATFLLNFHNDLMTKRNVAFSQPYYSRHPVVHLWRGEVKPFLKAYYNTVAALADRETYTFWEHFFHASPHKTHEEGWFLMQTRWMLWMEQGDTLKLLSGVPRSYLEDGKRIDIRNASSYFGTFSLSVNSELNKGLIRASVECATDRAPKRIILRLPHPLGRRATAASGGKYDPETETVLVETFTGRTEVSLTFDSRR